MADKTRQRGNPQESASSAKRPAGQQSDPESVVRKGGIAKSDAEIADVSRDTHGFPGGNAGTGASSAPSDMRTGAAEEADAALTEALEEAKATDDESEAAGE